MSILRTLGLIATGSFDERLSAIAACDWIIEAVSEDLAVKQSLYARVVEHRTPATPVSTNTSGIPLRQLAAQMPDELQQHFCGVHFFNPPRYMKLVEMIPGPQTLDSVFTGLQTFCEGVLGKGVVRCKDTPNFIANRLGAFLSSTAQRLTVEYGWSIEEADFLTGPLIGFPKSATFRLLDIVGCITRITITTKWMKR